MRQTKIPAIPADLPFTNPTKGPAWEAMSIDRAYVPAIGTRFGQQVFAPKVGKDILGIDTDCARPTSMTC
jgi:hypothetical protein